MRAKMWRWMCIAGLMLLTSCGLLTQTPPDAAVELAIVQQLTQTQQSLSEALGVNSVASTLTPNFKVESITVQNRTKLTKADIARSPGIDQRISQSEVNEVYRVSGTFRARLKVPGYDKTQPSSPFELYLGTYAVEPGDADGEVETWYFISGV